MKYIKLAALIDLLAISTVTGVYYNNTVKTESVYVCEINETTEFLSEDKFNAIKLVDKTFNCGKPISVNNDTLQILKTLSAIDNK
jgi:hypothetical protein